MDRGMPPPQVVRNEGADRPNVAIRAVAADERPIVERLVELYSYDLSPFLGADVATDGRYRVIDGDALWRAGCHLFLVTVDDHLAGFAAITRHPAYVGTGDTWLMDEFFVLRRFRRRGVGVRAAQALFDRFRGRWEVAQLRENRPAQAFWRATIDRYTGGAFRETDVAMPRWRGPVQSFLSSVPLDRDPLSGALARPVVSVPIASGEASAWSALLVGGVSGTGKSTLARQLGLRFGIPWLQVDLFRLAFQHSRATLPHGNDDLYLFWDVPDVWRLPPERLRDGLIGTGKAMSPAIEIATASQVEHAGPAILEGDGVLPSVAATPLLRERVASGQVALVFLVEPDEEVLLSNMLARGRGIVTRPAAEQRTQARAAWLFGQWLTAEAGRYGLPVVEPRPWETLADRILAAVAL